MNHDQIEDYFREVYEQTRQLYDASLGELGTAALGYRILYTPPTKQPEIMFLGFQPGGGEVDAIQGAADGELDSWPISSDYATADWLLARRVRKVFGLDMTQHAVGLNAIFFRAPDVARWNQLQPQLRKRLEEFSLGKARAITDMIQPKQIVVFGIGNFRSLAGAAGEDVLIGEKKRLVVKGSIWGYPAHGVLHLSGARPSNKDLLLLEHFFADNQGAIPMKS